MTIEQALRDLLVLARRDGWYADKKKQAAYSAGLAILESKKTKPKAEPAVKKTATKTKKKGK